MDAFDIVGLTPLMRRTEGRGEITVSVIDGPALLEHPAFSRQRIRQIRSDIPALCHYHASLACIHGTMVLGVLAARRDSVVCGLCPGCTFLVRPIFKEEVGRNDPPISTPKDLGEAITDSVSEGAKVINVSAAIARPASRADQHVKEALDYAARRGVLVVAAAGNQPRDGTSPITSHPWVIPVTSCDFAGRPTQEPNFVVSVGRWGLAAPGENITSVGSDGHSTTFSGTSAATPFVTGAIALLWSEFPKATASQIKLAMTRCNGHERRAIMPPVLDAWAAYRILSLN